eukprot:scaffold88029_cov24-Phaeocystis_antarctica.AAC.1
MAPCNIREDGLSEGALNQSRRPVDVVGRVGPARAAGSCRGALEMGWRDCWWPSRATHSLPCPPYADVLCYFEGAYLWTI